MQPLGSKFVLGGFGQSGFRLEREANQDLIRSRLFGCLGQQIRCRLEFEQQPRLFSLNFVNWLLCNAWCGSNRPVISHGRCHKQQVVRRPQFAKQTLQISRGLEPNRVNMRKLCRIHCRWTQQESSWPIAFC